LCHVASAGSGNSGRIVPATAIPPFVVIASPLLLDQARLACAYHHLDAGHRLVERIERAGMVAVAMGQSDAHDPRPVLPRRLQDRSRIAAHRRVDEREAVVLADEVAVDEAEALEPDEPRTVLGCLHAWAE
jgi:hypothetical protein